MTDISIFDEQLNTKARISSNGEVIVADYAYSDPYFVALADTSATQIVPGLSGQQFVITAFWIIATKTVSPTDAGTTIVYEADPSDIDTNLNTKISVDLVRNQTFPSPGPLRMRSGIARSLVATTTDPTVNVTIVGYYVPIRPEDA